MSADRRMRGSRVRVGSTLGCLAFVAFGVLTSLASAGEVPLLLASGPGESKKAGEAPSAPAPASPAEKAAGPDTAVHAVDITEPDGYREDDYRKPVPKTLKGAKVIETVEAEKLHAGGGAVFIDVYPRAPKPPNLPAGTIWRDPPHSSIKGGVWLPNVGYGKLPPEDESYFQTHLAALTGGDKSKGVVFYCLRDCWMSWNAAKRAMTYGYTNVIWFPEGTDGWQEAGNDTANLKPEPAAKP